MVLPELTVDGNLVVNGSVTSTGAMTPGAGVDVADTFTVHDPADPTKKARIDCGGVTAANTRVLTAPDYDGTIATLAGIEALTNKTLGNTNVVTLHDHDFTLQDNADATKQAQFEASGITAGQTRSFTLPDKSGTLLLSVPPARPVSFYTVASKAEASDQTYTAAQLLGGMILRDCNGAHREDTLPTAALLVAAVSGAVVGTGFEFTVQNFSNAAETITIAVGVGGTADPSSTLTIAQNNSKRFLVVFTNVTGAAEAYTLYSLGTVVH